MKKIIICLLLVWMPVFVVQAVDNPAVVRYTLNGAEADASINPTTKKDTVLNISIDVDRSVKLTRVYFCPESVVADKCTQDYTKYVSPNTEGSTVTATWDGYKKSDSGPAEPENYWLRILLKEGDKDSVPINLTNYKIIVGEITSVVATSSEDDDVSTTTPETTPVQTSGGGGGGVSVHSSQADLSNAEIKAPSVGAGRKRSVTVGTQIAFDAWTKDVGSLSGNYVWSFGDGSSVAGAKVLHTYLFPGTYNVVLNANFNGQEAVSRTVVQVLTPEITIKQIDLVAGYVELANNSTFETNLFGWNLGCDNSSFVFPRDTIISAKDSLKISLAVTKCVASTTAWSLSSQGGKILAQYQTPASLENTAEREQAITSIKQKIDFVTAELAKMKGQSQFAGPAGNPVARAETVAPMNNQQVAPAVATSSLKDGPRDSLDSVAQTAGVIVLDQDPLPANKSFFARIKSWFGR